MMKHSDFKLQKKVFPHVIILFIGILTSLILYRNINTTLFLALSAVIYFYNTQLGKADTKEKELIATRRLWIKTKILELQNYENSSSEYELDVSLGIKNQEILSRKELGLETNIKRWDSNSPDIVAAEEELIKLEERASFLVAGVVFLPVLFGMMHLFRYVNPVNFCLEIIIFITLGQLLTLSQTKAYNIDGWGKMRDMVKNLRTDIIVGGRKILNYIPITRVQNINELGMNLEFSNHSNAENTVAIALRSIIYLPPELRKSTLQKFIQDIEELPTKERVIKGKWKAYKSRIIMITSVSMALSALFSALARIDYSDLSDGLIPLMSTPYLTPGMFFLTMVLAILISGSWMKKEELIRWGIIWTFIFLFMNSILLLIIG